MSQIDQNAYTAIQPELLSGESILWAGRPSKKVIFHASDALMIPFSLLWGGFALVWESMVFTSGKSNTQGPSNFMLIWGIPFIVIGQYLIWGRFFHDAWLKGRTFYAVTNRRVLGVQRAYTSKTWASDISTLPVVEKELRADGFGTLQFGLNTAATSSVRTFGFGSRNRQSSWSSVGFGSAAAFVDIEDVDAVYRQINDLKSKV